MVTDKIWPVDCAVDDTQTVAPVRRADSASMAFAVRQTGTSYRL